MSQQLARYGTGSSKSSAASRCTWKSVFWPSCHSISSHVIPFFSFPTAPIQPLCCGKMSSSFFPGMTSQAQSAQVPRNPYLLQLKGCSALSSMSLPRLKISRNLKNTFRSNTNCIAGLSKAMRVEGEARQQWFYKQHCESSTSSVFEISNQTFSPRASRPRLQFHRVPLALASLVAQTHVSSGMRVKTIHPHNVLQTSLIYLDFTLYSVNPYMILR